MVFLIHTELRCTVNHTSDLEVKAVNEDSSQNKKSTVATVHTGKGKAVPLQAWIGPEGSRKLRFPDFMTTGQDGSKLLALRTGRLYPQEILLVLIYVRG